MSEWTFDPKNKGREHGHVYGITDESGRTVLLVPTNLEDAAEVAALAASAPTLLAELKAKAVRS